jgi:hypothetical protein
MKCCSYTLRMPTFILDGKTYEYLQPKPDAGPEAAHSWEYGHWPRVEAAVPLASGGTVIVYAEAMRWAGSQVLARWRDDDDHTHAAWLPSANVRRVTASEWDIIEYDSCPPELRGIRWGDRLPGFLPE